ncbi:hypothetical protein GGF46_001308 [Coemansia sp. RSA 552]|nr:hypothetical protein GGF46_001308 [Coemansia sp. RSA 552]
MSSLSSVYVTVGSTKFDELVRAVGSREFLQALAIRGFRRLVVQCGASIDVFAPPPAAAESSGIEIETFRYTNRPQHFIEQAGLVICHAGTGSILDALHSGKPTIAVVNRSLANNHQTEIAQELAAERYLYAAEPAGLAVAVAGATGANLRPYPRADPRAIGEIIDEETLGVTS